nr:uncharacterized protein LOC129010696 [Pongo pygmaeus]
MWPELKKPQAQLQACSQQGRGAPHLPDGGQPGRGTPHFPDGVDGQRRSSLPRQLGGWAEALLTSQTTGWPGRGAPHFPDSWQPGKGAPHFPDGAAAGQRHSSLPRRLEAGQRRSSLPSQLGSRAEALLTCQRVGSPAKALLTSQTGRPGRGAPHLPVSWAAGQRSSLLPSQLGGRREALLTSQTGRRPGRGAPHFRCAHTDTASQGDARLAGAEKSGWGWRLGPMQLRVFLHPAPARVRTFHPFIG